MIKIKYVADIPEDYRPKYCDGCNAEAKDDFVRIAFFRHKGFFWTDITLCPDCRKELYEKI